MIALSAPPALCALLVGALLAAAPPRPSVAATEWFVVCATDSGAVVVGKETGGAGRAVLAGPFPGERTAGLWVEENCPRRRCTASGRCDTGEAPGAREPQAEAGGWVAGELTSETLGASAGGAGAPAPAPSEPELAGPEGPGAADLSPLIANAKAAADACNYSAALASARHMTNFDPEHPWLRANQARLEELARRQHATEQLVWQASAELSAEELKEARKLAAAAADGALSCQTAAVRELVRGIDTAIAQRQQERAAANRQLAAALLPGLVDLARVISGGAAAGSYTPPPASSFATGPATTLNLGDPCSFRYEYRNRWNVEPVCTCLGYRFEARQHRCVRTPP